MPAARQGSGLGLIGMRERINAQGGDLSIENSTIGSGLRISARLPLQSNPVSMAVS
jgi:signal transduction histidine kinase